jgi:hypothetical protein
MTRKRPEKWDVNDWLLHHDNIQHHMAYIVQAFLVKDKMAVVPTHCNSPDLAPPDFFLFPKIKSI